MLHTFFVVMELECALVAPDADAVPTLRRLAPTVLILDLDLPDLRALDIARELRELPIILLTAHDPSLVPVDGVVLRKPGEFEELLGLFEMILAVE
jgi:DNA-binding response OmpR family regulator